MLSLQPARINRPNRGWIERERRGEEREGSIYNIVGLMALRLGWLPRSIRTRFWGRRNLVE